MDPNVCLEGIRLLCQRILNRDPENEEHRKLDAFDAGSLAEYVQALDEWIVRQGFLPRDWTPRP